MVGKQDKSMKAIRVHEFGGPEVLRLEEVPTLQLARGAWSDRCDLLYQGSQPL
ncbi:MAG TPA: hypothetical protein VFU08_07495 [Candidatus Udaeobacter sp.]|jgi:hypothetical protein|nr:hypothetical protein [Candidatus Udaeobacter sp.]